MTRAEGARALRALHEGEALLLLPNVWDACSCAIVAAAGAKAVATSSAGVAWSCGYPDGDVLPRETVLESAAAICRVAGGLPVSVDIESGFSASPQEVAALACDLSERGVAGLNIEDGAGDPDLLVAKIVAIKAALARRGGDVFVNARTDVYLRGLATGDAAVRESVARGQRYLKAGADGFFVPEVAYPPAIERIARSVALPLNVLATSDLASYGELYAMGVRRLSAGSALAKRAYGMGRDLVRAFLNGSDASALFDFSSMEYGELNALMESAAAT